MIRIRTLEDAGSRAAESWLPQQSVWSDLHQVQIIFGSRDRNCAGSGICTAKELQRQEGASVGRCRGNAATALVRMKRQSLVFTFASLCPRLIQQYFYGDNFLMECDACLELSAGGKRTAYVLPQGIYPVSRCKNGLVVEIPAKARSQNTYKNNPV